jgi:hypothetical protein
MIKIFTVMGAVALCCGTAQPQDQGATKPAQISLNGPHLSQKLSYSAMGLPPGLSIDPASGVISGSLDRVESCKLGSQFDVDIFYASDSGMRGRTSLRITLVSILPGTAAMASDGCADLKSPIKIEISNR